MNLPSLTATLNNKRGGEEGATIFFRRALKVCQRKQLSGHTCFVDEVERRTGVRVERRAPGRPQREEKIDASPFFQIVEGFRIKTIESWAKKALKPVSVMIFDGLACFRAVTHAHCEHDPIVCGDGRASVEEMEF